MSVAQALAGWPHAAPARRKITRGLLADRPLTGNPGSLYLPTDAPLIFQDNGVSWSSFGPIFPLTDPVDGDFSWANQGDATLDTAHGGIAIVAPASASLNWRIRYKTAPATPYTITALFLPPPFVQLTNNYEYALGFRQSSGVTLAMLVAFSTNNGGWSVNSGKYTSPTVLSASYASTTFGAAGGPLFMRVADNGTNRILSISTDGINFLVIHTVTRTDFLTADQVCFGVRASANTGSTVHLLSWLQG